MNISAIKFALVVVVADTLLSVPLIVAIHSGGLWNLDLVSNFAAHFDPIWTSFHFPMEKLISQALLGGSSMHDPVPLWFSFAYYGACFLQTFIISLCLFNSFLFLNKKWNSK